MDTEDIDQLLRMGMMPWVDGRLLSTASTTGTPAENISDRNWWLNSIPSEDQPLLSVSAQRKLAKKARTVALPSIVRGRVWLHVTGAAKRKMRSPSAFEDACQYMPTFATTGSSSPVPSFGATIDLTHFCLNGDGIDKYNRVLLCVAGVHPEVISYCPWLPIVVAACLHWMDERDAFAVACTLIREPSPLLMTRVSSWKMLLVFEQLVRSNLGSEFTKLCRHAGNLDSPPLCSKHPLAGVVSTWISGLKFWPMMRILDVFMIEGPRIFYQAGLVFIERWSNSMSMSSMSNGGQSGPWWYLPSSSARAVDSPDQLMKDCSKYNVSLDNLSRLERVGHTRAYAAMGTSGSYLAVGETEATKAGTVFESVRVAGKSDVISNANDWKLLWAKVPSRFRVKTLSRIFSTDINGYSLSTLYNLCEEESPTVLLVKTTSGKTFGAFTTYPWIERQRHFQGYFGNGDSFIFSLEPFEPYWWVGVKSSTDVFHTHEDHNSADNIPSLFMHGTDDIIAVGGGGSGHAIQLDKNLDVGHSCGCTTYGSPSLLLDPSATQTHGSETADESGNMSGTAASDIISFRCATVEVWAFAHVNDSLDMSQPAATTSRSVTPTAQSLPGSPNLSRSPTHNSKSSPTDQKLVQELTAMNIKLEERAVAEVQMSEMSEKARNWSPKKGAETLFGLGSSLPRAADYDRRSGTTLPRMPGYRWDHHSRSPESKSTDSPSTSAVEHGSEKQRNSSPTRIARVPRNYDFDKDDVPRFNMHGGVPRNYDFHNGPQHQAVYVPRISVSQVPVDDKDDWSLVIVEDGEMFNRPRSNSTS